MHRGCLHGLINSYHSFWWNNLILCLYNVDTLNICMKEFGSEKVKNDSCENLDNFSLIRLLYMHRWCLHGPINSYHSFWWNNLILCQKNVDTLNICMKEFGSQKIFLTIWERRQFFINKVFVYLCIEGAFMGRSTPTTGFDGAIWYFAYTMLTHWTYAWRSLAHEK